MASDTHLIVRGPLVAGRFSPRVGRETSHPPVFRDRAPNTVVRLLDIGGRVVSTGAVELARMSDVDGWSVRAVVALVPEASSLELAHEGAVVYGASVAARAPRVIIDEISVDGHRLGLAWSVDGEGPVEARVGVQLADGRRIPVAWGLREARGEFDLSQLPSTSSARATVFVSDGVRSSSVSSAPFTFLGRPPACQIVRPAAGERLAAFQPVSVMGWAREADGQQLDESGLTWAVDGVVVAAGSSLEAISVEPGRHTLELRHRDAPDGTGFREILILEPSDELARLAPELLRLAAAHPDLPVETPSEPEGQAPGTPSRLSYGG